MSSYGHPAFNPLDLEIIDRVYEAAWAQLLAMNLPRDELEELERQKNLRKRLFALARPGGVEFDSFATWFWPATSQRSRRSESASGEIFLPIRGYGSVADINPESARPRLVDIGEPAE
jgi:hypothetical protein